MANLRHTPKVYSLLTHAPSHMKNFKGIGDLSEDNVDKMHQARSSRLKSATAVAQVKMEAMSHIKLVRQLLQQLSKRKLDVNDIKKEKVNV